MSGNSDSVNSDSENRPKARKYAPQAASGADPRFGPSAQPLAPAPHAGEPTAGRTAPRLRLSERLGLAWQGVLLQLARSQDDDQDFVPRKLNWRLIVVSAIVVVAAAVAAPLWHHRQLVHYGGALLERAKHYEGLEDWSTAADYAWRYVSLTGDRSACLLAAENYRRAAETPAAKLRALELYLLAVAHQEDVGTRQRIADLAFEIGDDRLALDQVDRIAAEQDLPQEMLRLRALAMYRLARLNTGLVTWGDTAEALESYLRIDRENDVLSLLLADLYRRDIRDRPAADCQQAADLVMDRLVKAAESRPAAWLARHAYRVRYQLPDAEHDLLAAQKLAPDDPQVLEAAAQWAVQSGDFTAAAEQYQRLAEQNFNEADRLLKWGETLIRVGQRERAETLWTEALDRPLVGLPAMLLRVAELKLERKETTAAEELLYRVDMALESLPADTLARDASLWRIGLTSAQAQLRFARGEYAAARQLWQSLINSPEVARHSELTEQRSNWLSGLAECQVRLGQPEQATALFKEVAVLQPNDARQAVRAAAAYERAGQYAVAQQWYSQAANLQADSPDAWAGLARLELVRQSQTPPEERDGRELDRLLRALEARQGNPVVLRLLEAQRLNLNGQAQAAVELLERTAREHGDSEPAARSWLLAAEQWGGPQRAQRAWDEYVQEFGHTVWARQVEARRRVQAGETEAALADLWSAARQTGAEQAESLATMATAIAVRHQGVEAAIAALDEFCRAAGTLETWRLLAELNLEQGDFKALEEIEPPLKAREGDAGVAWRYFRAQRLLSNSEPDDRASGAELERLIRAIEDEAPSWPPGLYLRGRAAQRRGNRDQAIGLYESAAAAGERLPMLYSELITLLYQTGRIDQAARYLQRLESASGLPGALGEVAVDVYLQQGRMTRALELAKEELTHHPDDLASHLWHSQALLLNGDTNAALAAHFQALAAFPADMRCWTSLHQTLLEVGRLDLDTQLLQQADVAEELSPPERLLFAARGWTDQGKLVDAATRWRRLLEEFPDDAAGARGAGEFFAPRDPATATGAWRRAVELKPADRAARRELASLLTASDHPAAWSEAQRLLTADDAGSPPELDDLRLWGRLLLRRNKPGDIAAARKTLESVVEQHRSAGDADRLLLAEVCYQTNDEPAAMAQLQQTLARRPDNPPALAAKADIEMKFGALRDARATLGELAKLAPVSVDRLRLELRMLGLTDQAATATEWVQDFFRSPAARGITHAERGAALAAAAQTLAELGDAAAAGRFWRLAVQDHADTAVVWCDWLLARSQPRQALLACLAAAEAGSVPAGVRLPRLLREAPKVTDEVASQGLKALDALAASQPGNADVLAAAAAAHAHVGVRAKAESLARRALEAVQGHLAASYTLAVIQSESLAGAAEADETLARAVRVYGRRASLCDALGLSQLAQERYDSAAALFEEALADAVNDEWLSAGQVRLHLARALAKQDQPDLAAATLGRAVADGLAPRQLSPRDRQWLEELQAIQPAPTPAVP